MPRKKTKSSKPLSQGKKAANNPYQLVIDTEGVQYVINWDTFPVMGFVFIRCLQTEHVLKKLRSFTQTRGIQISTRVGIRNGYWGVGVWRVK
jgi:hypothetical protein